MGASQGSIKGGYRVLEHHLDEQLSLSKIGEYLNLDIHTVSWLAHSQRWSYVDVCAADGTERKYIVASLRREVRLQIAEGFSHIKENNTWV